ncbi:uncharacterized protein J4E84_006868 [Alternaria hordeiaustralica]|uniref:uncharacterized protein n=1 Tax=Alternaria hordeiaustralica TaxID=1187925 RepID=UPI0020C2E31B|nr:uncharacterized protein J4E84_006868 [Alternaria hordeiaustralica]KAI4682966.1 hypothetical protein J4E84_006868 [Alternaria hordeiaustralica]
MSSFTLTPIVQQAVEHRLEELERIKKSFERRYLSEAAESDQPSIIVRLERLLNEVKNLEPKLDEEDGDWLTETIQRCIEQAQDDGAISEKKLLRLEKSLRDKLSRFRNRMEVSCLHAQLIKEATNAAKIETAATKLEAVALDNDDFEVVDNESEEVLEKFEKACSQATNVDNQSIETYLLSLFTSEDEHLQSIRDGMQAYGDDLRSGEIEVDEECLTWITTDLMKSERISPERKATLVGYLQSPDALRELVATLNMMSYRDWNYRNAEAGLPVEVRKTKSGQHYVHVEVDIIDMLFLHCCAIGWAVKLNECLKNFVHESGLFRCAPLAEAELDKRAFFFDTPRPALVMDTACGGHLSPPPPPLPRVFQSIPPPPPQLHLHNSGKGSRKKKRRDENMYPMMHPTPPQPPPAAPMDVESLRRDYYEQHFFMSRLPHKDGEVPKIVSSEDVQARLIKTLAVECKLRKAFDGKVCATTFEFDSIASTVPHQTIITTLRFLGVPEVLLEFFTRALEPKLGIRGSASESDKLLTPASGVAVAHGLEMLFSEAVLTFLDLATHKATNSYMYRLYDRCYFVGTAVQVKSAEQEALRFSDIMGLKLRNTSSIGGLSIGLLTMGSQGSLSFDKSEESSVDDIQVALYATHVEARLKACSTVLEWIREWNDTVGTYAAQLFGPLANVFDAAHRDAVKSAYRRIHSIVLGGSDLTTYVAKMLNPHLRGGLERMSFDLEPIIYLPQSYGGLGVKTPFAALASAAKISESGSRRIERYLGEEAAYYEKAADRYTLASGQRQQRLETIFNNDLSRMISALGSETTSSVCLDALPFMTEAEMTEHRERTSYPLLTSYFWKLGPVTVPDLLSLYHDLLGEDTDRIEESQRTKREVQRLSRTRDLKDWYRVSQLKKWTLQLHSEECFERYGGLEIWWAEGMPVEVYNSLRSHMSDDDDDDDDCSSMVEIV